MSYLNHKPIKMKVAHFYPPNYLEIIKAIPGVKGKGNIVFTYGDTIYRPAVKPMDAFLLIHEEVHAWQQGKKPKAWWDKYLVDTKFRFEQELEAYRVQWQALLYKAPRDYRRKVLNHICNDLSGDMYGNLCTKTEAKELITNAVG